MVGSEHTLMPGNLWSFSLNTFRSYKCAWPSAKSILQYISFTSFTLNPRMMFLDQFSTILTSTPSWLSPSNLGGPAWQAMPFASSEGWGIRAMMCGPPGKIAKQIQGHWVMTIGLDIIDLYFERCIDPLATTLPASLFGWFQWLSSAVFPKQTCIASNHVFAKQTMPLKNPVASLQHVQAPKVWLGFSSSIQFIKVWKKPWPYPITIHSPPCQVLIACAWTSLTAGVFLLQHRFGQLLGALELRSFWLDGWIMEWM